MMRFTNGIRRAAFLAALVFAGAAHAGQAIEMLKSDGCTCCSAWGRHMQENGFQVSERDIPFTALQAAKTEAGLKEGQTSCHTAKVGGYVIEGHVPAREVKRLLSERPDAIGLTVPGMRYGSPGMGEDGPDAEPYDVLLVRKDGTTEVYASYR